MERHSTEMMPAQADGYDPFIRGQFPVGVRTIQALDAVRTRQFSCEIWYPAAAQYKGQDLAIETQDHFTVPSCTTPRSQTAIRNATSQSGSYPLVIFSHGSARGARRMSTFLCTHLSSYGYVVAALDHSEVVATELAPQTNETAQEKAARIEALIASRVPDISFLLDFLRKDVSWDSEIEIDFTRVGIAGYSFGGWTALAAPEAEKDIRAVVALAPAGSSQPKPGILPVKLTFNWGRDIPTLYLVAENDVMTPLAGMHELFERTPATRQMVILRRADHAHFLDQVEQEHEAARTMPWPEALAWIPQEMKPIAELCSGVQSHVFVRGLALCHMDAVLKQKQEAQRLLASDVKAELATHGVEVITDNP